MVRCCCGWRSSSGARSTEPAGSVSAAPCSVVWPPVAVTSMMPKYLPDWHAYAPAASVVVRQTSAPTIPPSHRLTVTTAPSTGSARKTVPLIRPLPSTPPPSSEHVSEVRASARSATRGSAERGFDMGTLVRVGMGVSP
jgi:hypothetical protein